MKEGSSNHKACRSANAYKSEESGAIKMVWSFSIQFIGILRRTLWMNLWYY